jgi:hypothetical protein
MKKNNVSVSQHKIKRALANVRRIKGKIAREIKHTDMLERAIAKGMVLNFDKVDERVVARLIQRQGKVGQK